ncbi:MAG: ComEC/Rec2 family competence protein [bacterium]|nr:ComEC/Rec2 family competence protein [bacterium]MDZ4284590.1 ComEC/Rec2 family competence protein [Patescibacteria group bacterium]
MDGALLMFVGFKKNIRSYALVALFAVTVFVWYAALREERGGVLSVAFLDVGQGDAALIESPTGRQVLIDGGPGRSVLRALGRTMPFFDRSIDVVIATHPDQDHIGGLPEVLARYRVSHILEPGVAADTAVYGAFAESVRIEGAEHILARRGQKIELGGGAYLDILFPDRDAGGLETNTASVVLKLTYGATSFLLTGDSPKQIEEYLAALDGEALDVDVLKAGHHGSKTSTSDYLLGLASPAYAVISAGHDNRYGHPHREVLDALARFGVKPLGTYERGTIIFESDGREVRLKK